MMSGKPKGAVNTIDHPRIEERKERLQRASAVGRVALGALAALLAVLVVFGCTSLIDLAVTKGKNKNAPTPVVYQNITKNPSSLAEGALVLVNGETELKTFPEDKDLALVSEQATQGTERYYSFNNTSLKLRQPALNAFSAMMKDFFKVSGGDGSVVVTAAYRTPEEQSTLSTKSGFSDHQTGYLLAVQKFEGGAISDLDADHWIFSNCWKYGFIIRYPADKTEKTGVAGYTYAIRYVGTAAAAYMTEHSLCLEEFVTLLQSYTGNKRLSVTDADGNKYELYYTPAGAELTTVAVPANYEYSVSGDNRGGYIVVVNLSKPIV